MVCLFSYRFPVTFTNRPLTVTPLKIGFALSKFSLFNTGAKEMPCKGVISLPLNDSGYSVPVMSQILAMTSLTMEIDQSGDMLLRRFVKFFLKSLSASTSEIFFESFRMKGDWAVGLKTFHSPSRFFASLSANGKENPRINFH